MKTPTLLLTLLLLTLMSPTLAQQDMAKAPSGSVILKMNIAVQFGDKKMAAKPVVAVAPGQEAEMTIAEDEENKLAITVLPIVEQSDGGAARLNLTLDVNATANGKSYKRRMQFTTIAGVDNKFQDKQSDAEMSLKVNASIVP